MLHFCRARLAEDFSSDDPTTHNGSSGPPPRFSGANFANSAAQFVKFRKISRHCYPQIPYIERPVGVVVLTDNTSKYKEFILTCNTITHYVRPLMMKILSCCSCHNTHNYHKSKLTTTRFYCFAKVKS